MAQKKILLDSNSYFRLAKSIHPLLDVVYGTENCCLYVLKELDDEFDRSRRLKNKFDWVNDDEYIKNRKKRLVLSRKDKNNIATTEEMLWQHKLEHDLGTSRIDVQCLSHGFILNIPVVTDDADMLQLAKDFDLSVFKTLELMLQMVEYEHINMDKVRQIVSYWEYTQDTPGNFRNDFKYLFKEEPP